MSRKLRIILYTTFGLFVLAVFIILITANSIVKRKLEHILQNDLPETVVGSYKDITVNTFSGSLSVNQPSFILKNKENGEEHTFITAEEIRVGKVNYRKLLFNDELQIGKISVDQLFAKHYKNLVIKEESKEKSDFDMSVLIKKVELSNSAFEIYENKEDSLAISGNDIGFTIKNFEVNPEILKRKIPFQYESFDMKGNTFFIKTSPEEQLTFDSFKVNNNDFEIFNIRLITQKSKPEVVENQTEDYFDLEIQSVAIHKFDFESFETKDTFIKSEGISIRSPNFTFYQNKSAAASEKNAKTAQKEKPDQKPDSTEIRKFPFDISTDSLKIEHAHVRLIHLLEENKEELQLESKDLSLKIEAIDVNEKTLQNKIPFSYSHIFLDGNALFVHAGPYENLTVENLTLTDNRLEISDLLFKTKYSRAELSRIIPVERDHYTIAVPSIAIEAFDFGFKEDETFFTTIKKVVLKTPDVDIYRDKLVRDDNSFKPLYSRSLRQLSFDLDVDSVRIYNAYVKYTERTHAENNGGVVSFKNLNAKISTIGNTYKAPEKTNILVDALFMDHAPLKADWSFDVQNPYDAFVFKGELSRFDVKQMNRFTEANIRTRVDGYISKTYFTIDGNNERSRTDMKINYRNLKVDILKKDSKETRKFLSGAANLFLKAKDIGKKDGFRDGTGEADRHKTQSVFNQLWISVQSALRKTII